MYSEKSCKNITEKNNSKACQAFRAALHTFQQHDFVKAEMHINAYKAYVDYNAFFKHDNLAPESPSASIIIVAYNTRQELIECIKSILAGTRKDIEIIVVDNGGNEEVMPLLTTMPLLYIQTPMNFILSEGRNIGVTYAKGPVCIFLDDDAIAPSAYVEHTLAAFVTQEIIAVRGKIFPKTQGAFHGTYPHYDLGPKPLPHVINTEGNSAWRTDAYRIAGGMNPLLFGYEGTDLSGRLAVIYGENVTFYWPVMHIFHDFATDEAKHIAKEARHRLMEDYLEWKCINERSKQNPREVPMAVR
jgi:GT2 family glycosyltransferase